MNKQLVWATAFGVFLRLAMRTGAVVIVAVAVTNQYGANFGYMVFGVGILIVWR